MQIMIPPYSGKSAMPLTLHFCGSEVCEPNYAFGPAIRNHYLFHFVTKGCGTYQVGDKAYKIGKNEGFMIFPGDTTYYKADDKDPWTYHWVSFSGPAALGIIEACGFSYKQHHCLPANSAATAAVIQRITDAAPHYTNDASSYYAQISDLFALFSTMTTTAAESDAVQDDYAEQAAAYIRENYAYAIKIIALAKHIGVERSYLYRCFKEAYGLSPKEYLIDFRLQKAKALLAETNMPIAEIAYSIGFNSNALFYRHFTDAYVVTPGEFRGLNQIISE